MEFRTYEKVHRLGKEETDGILEGICFIQEKLDGANTSIWIGEDGLTHTGSRSRDLKGDGFNGFTQYALAHEGIQNLLRENPTLRLYGEWLVRHTLSYPELAYKKFYLFDVHDGEKFLSPTEVERLAQQYGIEMVHSFGCFTNPTVEQLKEFVGKSAIAEAGEGIVIKRDDFINPFGERVCAKIVTENFKEDNAIVFGGNNKHSDTYWEVWIVNTYMSVARIQKIMNKLQPEIDKRLDMEHCPRIANTAYHDMLTEEIWDIAKKVGAVDFKSLKRIATKKAIQIYKEILTGDISVAHG